MLGRIATPLDGKMPQWWTRPSTLATVTQGIKVTLEVMFRYKLVASQLEGGDCDWKNTTKTRRLSLLATF